MSATQAVFTLPPDYSVVDPRRNWYQISVAGSDRPVYAEESPTNVVRRLQAENGLSPADGVIRDDVLSLVERLVSEGARRAPSDSADIYMATIRDDRQRFRRQPSGPVSEGTWKSIIWASRDDLRQSPQVLFDGALRLDAYRDTRAIRMPLFGVDLPVVLGSYQGGEKPALAVVPSEAGSEQLPGGSTTAIAVTPDSAASSVWQKVRPYAPAVIAGAVGIAGIAILWSLMKKDEGDSQSFDWGRNQERMR